MAIIAGVDEAGRGPLAGPVVAAAVILPNSYNLEGLDDSKKVTPIKRSQLYIEIYRQATAIGVGIITGLILVLTFIPSPLVFGESQFSIDITEDENHFAPVLGESNSTSLVILNNGKFDGWDNITLNLDKVKNYTITLQVEYINVSEFNKQFNSSSVNFSRYVYWDKPGENLTLNLTSKSYANLTLSITPIEEPMVGEISFDLKITSRTERVYTRTFVLVTEAQS